MKIETGIADNGAATTVTLVDVNGLMRQFDVPGNWINDIEATGPLGFGTLDFAGLGPQTADTGDQATVSQNDAGFDLNSVVSLEVDFSGSGALDNLNFIPAPGTVALALAGLGLAGRRRR
jgi:uncharacterized protein (TIGR03382 family)